MEFLRRHFRNQSALRAWSIALLIANCGIVVTGALVRLTNSGLGCPTWPGCTDESFIPSSAHGIHGLIEFGNRTLTFLLIFFAVGMLLASYMFRDENGRRRPRMRTLAWLVLIGMPLQGVVGGITVLTQLNPYVVGLHMLLSAILIAMSVQLVRRAHGWRAKVRPTPPVFLARIQWAVMWVVVVLGIIVTGSGPHAGDPEAPRTGFDFLTVARVHAGAVWVFVAVVVALVLLQRTTDTVALLIGIVLQGAFGYAQIIATNFGVPFQALVILHLLGVSVVVATSTNAMLAFRRPTVAAAVDQKMSGSTAMATNTNDR